DMIDVRSHFDQVAPFAPCKIVGGGNGVADDVSNPVRRSDAGNTRHAEFSKTLRSCVTQIPIGKPELVVPVLVLTCKACAHIGTVESEAEFVRFCSAKRVKVRNLHVLIERFGIDVSILKELIHVGGVKICCIKDGITEKDAIRTGAVK